MKAFSSSRKYLTRFRVLIVFTEAPRTRRSTALRWSSLEKSLRLKARGTRKVDILSHRFRRKIRRASTGQDCLSRLAKTPAFKLTGASGSMRTISKTRTLTTLRLTQKLCKVSVECQAWEAWVAWAAWVVQAAWAEWTSQR